MAPKRSAKARKRDRRKNNNTHTSESSELSSALTTPRTSITSTTSTTSNPKETLKEAPNGKQRLDSINSHRFGTDEEPTSRTKIQPNRALAYSKRWIRSTWPCRLFRWLSMAIPAFFRGLWRTSYENKIFSVILIIGVYFAFWSAVEGILQIFRGVAAQHTLDASCSAVYVTIPGPIITISLIGATPTDSARGTYYYSVINGTTQWLNNIAPPTGLASFSLSTPAITTIPTPVLSPITGFPPVSPQPPSPATIESSIALTLPASISSISSRLDLSGISASSDIPPSPFDSAVRSMSPSLFTTRDQPPVASSFILTSIIIGSLGEPISTLTLTSLYSTLPPPVGPSRPYPIPPAVSEITTDLFITPSLPPFKTLSKVSSTAPDFLTISTGSPKMTSTIEFMSLISGELTRITSVVVSGLVPPPQPGFPSSLWPVTTLTLSQSGQSTSTILLPPPISSLPGATNPVVSFTESLRLPSNPSDPLASASVSRMPSGTPSPPDRSTLAFVPSSTDSAPSISGSDTITIETSKPRDSASGSAPGTRWSSPRLTISMIPDPLSASVESSTGILISSGEASPGLPSSLKPLPSISISGGVSSPTSSLPFLSTLSSSRGSSPSPTSGILTTSLKSSKSVSWTSRSLLPSSELNVWPSSNPPTISGTSITHLSGPTSLPGSSDQPVDVSSSGSVVTLPSTSLPSLASRTRTSGATASSSLISTSSWVINISRSSSSVAVTSTPMFTSLNTGSQTSPPVRTSSRFLNITTPSSSSSFSFVTSLLFKTTSSASSSGASASRVSTISSPGWNRTTTSRTICTGFVTSPGCESLQSSRDDVVTRILAYSNTAYTFAFPSPDITTTVSYWTGNYPSITGSEPSPIPPTTRTLRQTPLSALPSIQLFARADSSRTTLETATVSAPVSRRADIEAAAEPATCGEYGNFTLGFDDSTTGPEDRNILPVAPVKNPYHHLFYSNGIAYVPDNWEPYPAISQPNVAMFLPISGLLPNSPFAGTLLPGELGAGPRASVDAYWFNAYSGFFGCALNGITRCTLRITGYRYDAVLKGEVVAAEQNATIAACYGYVNCRLVEVGFSEDFRGLSGIQFQAYTYNLGVPQIYMMDDLQMEWYNNTCGAGILRIGHR